MPNADNVTWRVLTDADLETFRRMRLEALQSVPTAFTSGSAAEISRRAAQHRKGLTGSAENFVLGAWQNDQLAGFCGLLRETDPKRRHTAWVWGLYVQPAFRGQRIGRGLLDQVAMRARHLQDMHHLLASAISDNERALALYQAAGFQVWGTEPGAILVEDQLFDEIHLQLPLSS